MNPRSLLLETAARFRAAGIPDPEYDSAMLLSSLTGRSSLPLRMDTDTVPGITAGKAKTRKMIRRVRRERRKLIVLRLKLYYKII